MDASPGGAIIPPAGEHGQLLAMWHNPRVLRLLLRCLLAGALAALLGSAGAARAHGPHDAPEVEQITVWGRPAPAPTASSELVRDAASFELRPIESPSQLLEVTPGLITAQHAGGGKSDQLLIRGFDADHGTDLAILFDDIPVNLRSHAHGQGYADLHFVIPETVEELDIYKGPYDARVGDFSAAGTVRLVPRRSIEESFAKVEVGDYDTLRGVALFSPRWGPFGGKDARASALLAAEGYWSDGPFDDPEALSRFNLFGRVGYALDEDTEIDAWASYYRSDWNASGQIPRRAVQRGLIDRFGSLDPHDGGASQRWNALARLGRRLSERERVELTGWVSRYELDLYSDFTFLLSDPQLGDAIAQRDDRVLYGARAEYQRQLLTRRPAAVVLGLETRFDDAFVRLGRQRRRQAIPADEDSLDRENDIFEASLAAYAQAEVELLPWVRWIGGFRAEQFRFAVDARGGRPTAEGHDDDMLWLPKANLVLRPFSAEGPWASGWAPLSSLQLFLNYGSGFHSNDARDVVEHPHATTLPRSNGYEVGLRTQLGERLDVALSLWQLDLQGELVFVGDEGMTEPSGRSRRRGVELSARLELLDWLSWDADLSWSSGEFANQDKVPQAPRTVLSSGLAARHRSGWAADLRTRYLGRRFGTESGRPRLHSYTVWDAGVRYRRGPWELFVKLENLFDAEWESAEFFYASRLAGEPDEGFEDFHFTPGNDRNLRGGVTFYFR